MDVAYPNVTNSITDSETRANLCLASLLVRCLPGGIVYYNLLVTVLFIRHMVIIRTDLFTTDKQVGSDKMSMKTLGYLSGLMCAVICVPIFTVFFLHKRFPYDRLCRGKYPLPVEVSKYGLYYRVFMFHVVFFIICFIFRIYAYKRKHPTRYHFGNFRQSLITTKELIMMIAVGIVSSILRSFLETYFLLTLGATYNPKFGFEVRFFFDLILVTVRSVLVPLWILFSCWKDFPELWSTCNTVFAASKFQTSHLKGETHLSQ